jgi:hypothetical protein
MPYDIIPQQTHSNPAPTGNRVKGAPPHAAFSKLFGGAS